MNKFIKKILFTEVTFMPELHLKLPGLTYSAYGPFTKHCERIKKFRETSNLKHLHRNALDKACFAYDAVYSDSKGVPKRTISDRILKDRAYEITRNDKHKFINFLIRKQDQEKV